MQSESTKSLRALPSAGRTKSVVEEVEHQPDPVDWDSDHEDAGAGNWVNGEWVPVPFVKKKVRFAFYFICELIGYDLFMLF